jgi:hypothetical protein
MATTQAPATFWKRWTGMLLLGLICSGPLVAQRWVSVGPGGGVGGQLAAASADASRVYLLGRSAPDLLLTLHSSGNGGRSWQTVPGPTLSALLAVDPAHAETLFGLVIDGSQTRLSKSVDGGMQWQPADAGLAGNVDPFTVNAAVFDSQTGGSLLAATDDGLFASQDRGDSWQALAALAGVPVGALAVSPPAAARHWLAAVELPLPGSANCDPDTATCTYADILESADGGATWQSTHYPAPDAVVTQLVAGAAWQVALAGGQVMRRRPGGAWLPGAALPDVASQLARSPDDVLYAATGVGVFYSLDGARSWLPGVAKAQPSAGVDSIVVLADAARTVLALGQDVWRSGDQGHTWLDSSTGLSGQLIEALAVAADSNVYAGLFYKGVMGSANQGASWQPLNQGLGIARLPPFVDGFAAFGINDLAADLHDAARVYLLLSVGQTSQVARLAFGGQGWELRPPLPLAANSFADTVRVDPSTAGSLYVLAQEPASGGNYTAVLLHSGNDGLSWHRLLTDPLAISSLAIDPRQAGTLYAWTFSRGILKSTNRGTTWRQIGTQLPSISSSLADTLALDPLQPQNLYAGTIHGVYASHDAGATFSPITSGLPQVTYSRKLIVDPQSPADLYLLDQSGFYRWNTAAAVWVAADGGLPDPSFLAVLAVDPQHAGLLYLGTNGRGIYRLQTDP